MKVILSTGIGRLHLVRSSCYLLASGVDIYVIQGWVPACSDWVLTRIGKLIGHPRLAYGLRQRRPPELDGRIFAYAFPEILHQVLVRLTRFSKSPRDAHWRMARLSWRFFGFRSREALHQAQIFHVRSGAGQGGAIRVAKARGMKVLVDHSIAHPAFMEKHLRSSYERNGQIFCMGPENPFWKLVVQDCLDADVLLVNSDFVKRTFVDAGYDAARIRVACLGVRPDFFGLKNVYDTKERIKKGLPVRLLFTGGFGFRKGGEYVLEAMRILQERKINVELTVVGSYVEAKNLIARYQDDALRVKWIGHVPQDDLKGYLAAADIYVFPSLAEGCASSGMEALAAGLCVVATEESGFPIKDGVDGYLVVAGNAQAIVDKVEKLIENPDEIERMGRAAAKLIRENFTWEHYAAKVKAVYQEMLDA